MRLRIGINLGDVIVDGGVDGLADLAGDFRVIPYPAALQASHGLAI